MLAIIKENIKIGEDITIIRDMDEFEESVAMMEIKPQEILYDESLGNCMRELLESYNFKLTPFVSDKEEDVGEIKEESGKEETKDKDIEDNIVLANKINETVDSDTEDDLANKVIDCPVTETEVVVLANPTVEKIVKKNKAKSKKDVIKKEKKVGIMGKLIMFGQKTKKEEEIVEEVKDMSNIEQIEMGCSLENALGDARVDLARGKSFKEFIVNNSILTDDEIKKVESKIEESKKVGHKTYFIGSARKMGLVSEDEASRVLSMISKKEIISKDVLDIEEIKELNRSISKNFREFFILDVDKDNKIIRIAKDLASKSTNEEVLEVYFIGYSVCCSYLVDGVTNEILKKLQNLG